MSTQINPNKPNSLLKSSFVVGSMTFISRISGFIRDIAFANIFGASASTDAFFVAFKIPNFFRRLFAEGAFIQAFVPVLNEFKIKNPLQLKNFLSYIQGNLLVILAIITTMGIIFSDVIVSIFAPGFSQTENRHVIASEMLQITFPYLLFISLTALSAGIFNTFNRFLLPAITPVILNISLITAALYFTQYFTTPIIALAYGVLVAGILQYAMQMPLLHKINLLVMPKINFRFEGVNKVIKLMLPAMLGTAVVQINLIIDSIVASMLAIGSISWLYYSDRLVEFPLGVFGIAIATVILPALSEKFSKDDIDGYKKILNNSVNIAIVFSLPAMFGLMVLSKHIISTLFEYGSFDFDDTVMSSLSLLAYAIGLPAFILMKVLLTGFFSRQDTKTPVKYGIIAVIFNIVMNTFVVLYYFQHPFQGAHSLLALATSLSAWIQVILLYRKLRMSGFIKETTLISSSSIKSLLSCILMGAILFYTLIDISYWSDKIYYMRGLFLIGYIIFGSIIYVFIMYLLGYNIKKIIYENYKKS